MPLLEEADDDDDADAARAKQLPGAIGPMPVLYISCRAWLVRVCVVSWSR